MNAQIRSIAAKAFLASTTGLSESEEATRKSGVRWAAWEATEGPGSLGTSSVDLFVAEYAWPADAIDNTSALDIATALLHQLRNSKRIILLLTGGSRGSVIKPRAVSLSTTYFELEVFQSILLQKPLYVLVHQSFTPSELEPYLEILSFAIPDWRVHTNERLSDSGVVSAAAAITKGQGGQWRVKTQNQSAAMHSRLLQARDRYISGASRSKAHFLRLDNLHYHPSRSKINGDAVLDLLMHRRPFEVEQDNDRRLAFSWLLLRELMAEPLLDEFGEVVQRDPVILAAWNAALRDWHGAASWMGLHSNIYLGTVPTLDTLDSVRAALRTVGPVDTYGEPTEFPGGAYSSSYYSLSKRVLGHDRLQVLDLALKLLKMGVDEATFRAVPGNFSMLGSIALERGNPGEAVEHFNTLLRMHESLKSTEREIGQAQCELAFAMLALGEGTRALSEANSGLMKMLKSTLGGEAIVDGFLCRAMFKTAFVNFRQMRFLHGWHLYRQAQTYATEKKLDDQFRQWSPGSLAQRAGRRLVEKLSK